MPNIKNFYIEMGKTKSLEKVNIPDGKYFAKWGAYIINVILPDWEDIDIKVNNGIRGIDFKCTVEVIDGWLYVIE